MMQLKKIVNNAYENVRMTMADDCPHKRWVRFYPPKGTCFVEEKSDKVGVSHSSNHNDTIVMRICMKCGNILECKDYGE